MTFGTSAHIAALYAAAPRDTVAREVAKLVSILGEDDPTLVEELSAGTITEAMLADLVAWNTCLAPAEHRDWMGHAATRFWAAQTLVATVMRKSAFDLGARFSSAAVRAMEAGADGLFDVGRLQFEALARTVRHLIAWLAPHTVRSVAIIESPLGNSLPVQLICNLAQRQGISVAPVLMVGSVGAL